MPVPEGRLWQPAKINRWFAVCSLFMTASIVWMIWVDYDRPWRGMQQRYFMGKAALAHLDYLNATTQERRQEIEQAEQRIADAEALIADTRSARITELEAERTEAELKFNVAYGRWDRKKQVLDVTRDTYEKVLTRYGPEHPKTLAAHRELRDGEDEVDRLRKEEETWGDQKASIDAQLEEINAPIRLAKKRLADLEQAAADALKKDQAYRGVLTDEGLLAGVPVVGTLINFPLLDFAAPKTTFDHEQVKQLVLPDVRQRLNYLESYTTDRCITCHIGIDDPAFSKDSLARKLERAIPAINEARQRDAKEPVDFPVPPVLEEGGPPLPEGSVTDHWDKLSRKQRDDYFDALLEVVNRYLTESGRKTIDLGQPILAHPNLDLFLSIKSPHPMAKMGCTVCHEGNPQETDFVQAAHTPRTHEIRKNWEEKYYIHELGVPNVTFDTIEHFWDRSMRLPQYSESGCAKCHREIADIARFEGKRTGSNINLGRHLFTSMGCINCHSVDALPNMRKVGPDLTYVGAKLKPEFVQQWIFFPQKFRPTTRMPHFFLQENNRDASATALDPEPQLRTETEVAAIAKYLFTVSDPWKPIAKPDDVTGDPQRGRDLFRQAGCLACHANIAEFGESWITADLMHREGLDEQTARYRYLGMTYEERARYAVEHFTSEVDTFLNPESVRFRPEDSYHKPTFTRFAPELSGIGSKVDADWLYSWLMEPAHYAADTKMPNLRLTPNDAADITAYLMTMTNKDFRPGVFELDTRRSRMLDDLVFTLLTAQRSERRSRAIMKDEGGKLTNMLVELLTSSVGREAAEKMVESLSITDKRVLFFGNKMIAHYGCYTCHKIRGFETTTPVGTDLSTWAEKPVSQLDFAFYDHAFEEMREERKETFQYIYPRDDKVLNHQSPIDDLALEQISQTHAAFAKHKLLNPRIWDREKLKKPYDKLKMPNFYFTEREAEALTTFLLSRIPPRVNDVLKINYEGDSLGPIARGRNLTRELNCIGCHQIEDNAPTIQQYFRREIAGRLEFDVVNAPPSLWGEGAKLQHYWLHKFLKQVEPLRPWLQVRMPSFTLTGDQATTLVEYFAALSRHDAAKLAEVRAPIDEYINEQTHAAETTAGNGSPGSDWFRRDDLARSTAALRRWAVERELMRDAELDPLVASPERLTENYATLLKKTEFMQKLYDVQYPFVEPPRQLSSREAFLHGQSFFNDMGCLQCHVLGNMLPGPAKTTDDFVQTYRLDGVRGEGDNAVAMLNGQAYPVGSVIDGFTLVSAKSVTNEFGDVDTQAVVEGPGPGGEPERVLLVAASAPNLSLTYQRLRRAWVFNWMLEPQWIQPGTKMPQNFAGGKSPFEGDENYPGTGFDHINLLVDYLYQAGATNERADLPKLMATPEEEFDEGEGDLDEEDFDD